MTRSAPTSKRPEVAYYYPAPYWGWGEGGWVKSLLLFFDQLSILLPGYMYGRHEMADPTLVIPLEERGLLQVLEPDEWVDEQMTSELAEVIVELLTNGAFDDLPKARHFAELSQSRMGYGADVGLADMLVEELQAKGLAKPSEDGVSIPLHPTVRMTILVILGQLSRAAGARNDLNVHPTTNDCQAIGELIETLSRDPMPSAAHVITLDLQPVTFDLDPIPLDDVLDFRTEHQAVHRAYMRDHLRRFMTELAGVEEPGDREALLVERRQEIADAADDIQQSTRRSLGKNLTSFAFGIAGAAWTYASGGFDLLRAALTAGGIASQALPDHPDSIAAYSYIFATHRQFDMGQP